MTALPLSDVRVLDFAHMMQGPWAAEMLGDLGADVIKVEAVETGERGRQSGTTFLNGTSAQFLAMNRNKRSVALDLKHPDGLAAAEKLVASADVLIQNFRPGVLDRLGLGWEKVRRLNPRLVYCTASGYGSHVPDVRKPGQDLLAQARTGALWLTGTHDDLPTPCGPFTADIHAATMLALGALAALNERQRTGQGRLIEVDLVGAMLHQTSQEVVATLNSGEAPRRPSVPGSVHLEAPYGVYRTGDGHIALSLTTMESLAEGLKSPDLLDRFPDKDSAVEHRDQLQEEVAELVSGVSTDELLDSLDAAGVWCAPVNDHRTMTEDAYVQWERRKLTVTHPTAGQVTLVGNPLTFDGETFPARRPAPLLGEHTLELLQELGLPGKELLDSGAAGGPARSSSDQSLHPEGRKS